MKLIRFAKSAPGPWATLKALWKGAYKKEFLLIRHVSENAGTFRKGNRFSHLPEV
jgi:hypothetical protein